MEQNRWAGFPARRRWVAHLPEAAKRHRPPAPPARGCERAEFPAPPRWNFRPNRAGQRTAPEAAAWDAGAWAFRWLAPARGLPALSLWDGPKGSRTRQLHRRWNFAALPAWPRAGSMPMKPAPALGLANGSGASEQGARVLMVWPGRSWRALAAAPILRPPIASRRRSDSAPPSFRPARREPNQITSAARCHPRPRLAAVREVRAQAGRQLRSRHQAPGAMIRWLWDVAARQEPAG